MGYDEHGRCPMLTTDGCSIYEHRPRTCRTYDCRVFPATGLAPDDDQVLIAARAARWGFSFPAAEDREAHAAVRAASAAALQARAGDERPPSATAVAVRAIETHRGSRC
jgi:Fe-S-cluster containining protein